MSVQHSSEQVVSRLYTDLLLSERTRNIILQRYQMHRYITLCVASTNGSFERDPCYYFFINCVKFTTYFKHSCALFSDLFEENAPLFGYKDLFVLVR